MKRYAITSIAILLATFGIACGSGQQKEKEQVKTPDAIVQKSVERIISTTYSYWNRPDESSGGTLKI